MRSSWTLRGRLRLTCSTLDILLCGISTYHLFNKTLASVPTAPELAASLAASLITLANEQLLSFDYKDVPVYWRRLHTDATLLSAIALLLLDRAGAEIVRSLDLALIVSGTPGEHRREITFALIARAQAPLLCDRTPRQEAPERPTKRARLSPLAAPPVLRPIPRLSSPPFPVLPSHPFILPAHCAHWPAATLWSSPAHLLALAGPARVVPVEVGADYTARDWGQRIIPLEDFLTSLDEGKETLYLAQHDLFRQIPALRDDVEIPDLVYSAPDTPADAPDYDPVANEEGYTLNAWLGPAGTVSPAHTDPYFNCYGPSFASHPLSSLTQSLKQPRSSARNGSGSPRLPQLRP